MLRPLLLLSCSTTKRDHECAAYQLYDGPAFRVLRASGFPSAADGPVIRVAILSAEHGLLSPWEQVAPYDRRMDTARAAEFCAANPATIAGKLFCPVTSMAGSGRNRRETTFEHFPASEVFVWGGALYRSVVQAWAAVGVFANTPGGVHFSSGGIGTQLGQLKRWLSARTALSTTPPVRPTSSAPDQMGAG